MAIKLKGARSSGRLLRWKRKILVAYAAGAKPPRPRASRDFTSNSVHADADLAVQALSRNGKEILHTRRWTGGRPDTV